MSEFKLCYIKGCWAYFMTAKLSEQWGDDWDDAPYEHNASEPYEWEGPNTLPRYEIVKVAFDAELETPAEILGGCNSSYSVKMINSGAVAWLTTSKWSSSPLVSIQAGCPLDKFCEAIRVSGGEVYVKQEKP